MLLVHSYILQVTGVVSLLLFGRTQNHLEVDQALQCLLDVLIKLGFDFGIALLSVKLDLKPSASRVVISRDYEWDWSYMDDRDMFPYEY